jgi:membrane glycosyltransferase
MALKRNLQNGNGPEKKPAKWHSVQQIRSPWRRTDRKTDLAKGKPGWKKSKMILTRFAGALDPNPNSEPHIVRVRTSIVDPIVWEDCCRVFERLELIQDVIKASIEQSVQNLLEDTKGNDMITALQEEIIYAMRERDKHPEGSYYYNLIAQDIRKKEGELQRCEEEFAKSHDVARLSGSFQESVMNFLEFLNTM